MLNRGAADDYDNWEKLDNPGWGWSGLLPYFVKVRWCRPNADFSPSEHTVDRPRTQSTTFQAPSPQLQAEFNITWNASAYGTDGPIRTSFAPFQWPGISE